MKWICEVCSIEERSLEPCFFEVEDCSEFPDFCPLDDGNMPDWRKVDEELD